MYVFKTVFVILVLFVGIVSKSGFSHEGHDHGKPDRAERADRNISGERGRLAGLFGTSDSGVLASVDVRPSWSLNRQNVETDNSVELGYALNDTIEFSYLQEFGTNLYDASSSSSKQGVNLRIFNGYFRGKFHDLWTNDEGDLSFSYESRMYLPTDPVRREAGLVTSLRNYIKLNKSVSNMVSITATEVIIVPIYSQAGADSTTNLKASPIFENRVYLTTDLFLTQNIILSLPVMLNMTRHAYIHPDAKNNDRWAYYLWASPEISYTLTANSAVGLAYYTGNLIADDFSGINLGKGLDDGVLQLVFQAWI